jgi:hypothetical protein
MCVNEDQQLFWNSRQEGQTSGQARSSTGLAHLPPSCVAVFFLLAKYRQMANCFSKMLILAIFFKNSFSYHQKIHPIWPFFIHLSNFSSDYDDPIQNLDESAALFISLVPHAR